MIRMFKAALAVILMVTAIGSATAQTRDLTLDEEFALQEISRHNSQIRTIAGRFVQIDSQGGRVEGTFWLKRPNKIRFRYAPPSREEIISQGRGFYVIDREERTQYAYNQEHVPLRQFLGDEVNLNSENLTDVVMSDSHVSVSLVDETPIGTVQVSLIFDRETKDLTQWSLIEPSGIETTFSIYDTQKDIDIPDHYFHIDPSYNVVQR